MSAEVESHVEVAEAAPRFESTIVVKNTGIKHFDRDRFIDALNVELDHRLAQAALQLLGKYVKPGEKDANMERYGNCKFHIECFGKNGSIEEHLPKPYTTHDTIATIAKEAWQDSSLDEDSYLSAELETPLANELIDGHSSAEVRIVLSVTSE